MFIFRKVTSLLCPVDLYDWGNTNYGEVKPEEGENIVRGKFNTFGTEIGTDIFYDEKEVQKIHQEKLKKEKETEEKNDEENEENQSENKVNEKNILNKKPESENKEKDPEKEQVKQENNDQKELGNSMDIEKYIAREVDDLMMNESESEKDPMKTDFLQEEKMKEETLERKEFSPSFSDQIINPEIPNIENSKE